MGGSSLAPEVMKRLFGVETFDVARHDAPAASARSAALDLERTLFLSASKSGLDARDPLAHRLLLGPDGRGRRAFVAITDPGSELELLARERAFAGVFHGEPTIGGRYSALSPFGIVPAALMGIDAAAPARAGGRDARGVPPRGGQPGPRARGRARRGLARGPRQGARRAGDFGLWVEQLLAESTGKQGKGLIPSRSASPTT